MGAEVQFKGLVFRAFLEAVAIAHGPSSVEAIFSALPPDLARKIRDREIVVGGFYPVSWYATLHETGRRVCGGGTEFSIAIGRLTTERDLKGLLKWLIGFISPARLLGYSERVWRSYVRGGSVTVVRADEQSCRVQYDDCYGITTALWDELLGGTEVIVGATGVTNVKVARIGGGHTGSKTMTISISWDPRPSTNSSR